MRDAQVDIGSATTRCWVVRLLVSVCEGPMLRLVLGRHRREVEMVAQDLSEIYREQGCECRSSCVPWEGGVPVYFTSADIRVVIGWEMPDGGISTEVLVRRAALDTIRRRHGLSARGGARESYATLEARARRGGKEEDDDGTR